MDIATILKDNGLTALLLIYLILERVGPTIWKRLYPDWKSHSERVRKEQLDRDKAEREDERRTEDRLFELAQNIVESNGKLNYTLEHMSAYLQGQSVFMREISLDIARIYTTLRIERNDTEKPETKEVNASPPSRKLPRE